MSRTIKYNRIMPNWCCTRYVASGDRDELERLVRTLNTMPDLCGDNPFSFGRYWMGNLVGALKGESLEEVMEGKVSCRGTLDPNFNALPCFTGPCVDEKAVFSVDGDGLLRFSATSAWGQAEDVEDLIAECFPSVELFWSSTDEFGNFHIAHNPEGYPDLDMFWTSNGSYSEAEFNEFLADIIEGCPGLEIPDDADEDYLRSDVFCRAYGKWREEHRDDEDPFYFGFYAEE